LVEPSDQHACETDADFGSAPQVFIIDPKKTIRLILSYPASTGRNTAEVLRVLDSLQTGDKHRITTPINWVPGDDVIVHPAVKNDEAKMLFPDFRIVKPYLRFVRIAYRLLVGVPALTSQPHRHLFPRTRPARTFKR
jgi:hypothetical protein